MEGWSKGLAKFWKKSNSLEQYSSVMVSLMNKFGTLLSFCYFVFLIFAKTLEPKMTFKDNYQDSTPVS